MITFVLFVVALNIVSAIVWHRSPTATLGEVITRITSTRRIFSSEKRAEKMFQKLREQEEQPFVLPELTDQKSSIRIKELCGMQVVDIEPFAGYKGTVLYLHGGAYVGQLKEYHFWFTDLMSKYLGMRILIPVYPLAPRHSFEDCYEKILALYKLLIGEGDTGAADSSGISAEKDQICIMGDSAGGGLALAFCQYLDRLGIRQPDSVVAISPWVDMTMTDPDIEKYIGMESVVGVPGARIAAECWANGTDLKDYRLSPIYGDVSVYKKVLMFIGTREVLYPDAVSMAAKMKEAGVDVRFVIGEGMTHIYPLYPYVHESIDAKKEIRDFLKEVKR